jgi:3-oxoacyl-[acyl-carrier protein] reductase/meso-butanediol dehydrogenase/(S,S)-butanediol dehydrogenase/diacetyl reductase
LAKELGEQAKFIRADVKNLNDHEMLVNEALKWTKRLDAYINCAGFSKWAPVSEIDESFYNEMMDTNLKGTFWGCKAAAGHLSKGGSIINISSLAGKRGSANNSVYCASKFGVNGITQSLAKELGPKGVRVNAVCTVYVKTEGVLEALADKSSPAGGKDVKQYLEEFRRNNAALLRLPSAEEVANVCYFLASDEASAVTGQCINVDCGVLPQ